VNSCRLERPYVLMAVCLFITIMIGVFVSFLPLNGIECNIVFNLQNFAQKTIGIQAFQALTYLGDFYLWVAVASIYLLYAYFHSRKHLASAIELAVFLTIATALTYSIKMVFARPRPNCPGISVYDTDFISSSSYPSGHVSRAAGAFIILSKGSRSKKSLAVIAIFIVSLSRIILGAHYLTDVVGGIFLSIAAQTLANLTLTFLARRKERGFYDNTDQQDFPGKS
jgi:membrane-associated phospholipid phosphatase